MNWRTFDIQVTPFGVRRNQPAQVARLKFVCLLCKGLQVTQPKVACARLKDIAEGERRERRIAAGASSGDSKPVSIYKPTLHEVASAIHAIIDIDDAPLTFKSQAILATIIGTATIVYIQNSKPA